MADEQLVPPGLIEQLQDQVQLPHWKPDAPRKVLALVLEAIRRRILTGWTLSVLSGTPDNPQKLQVRSSRGHTLDITAGQLRGVPESRAILSQLRRNGLDAAQASRPTSSAGEAGDELRPSTTDNGGQAVTAARVPDDEMAALTAAIMEANPRVKNWENLLPLPKVEEGPVYRTVILTPAVAQQLLDECDQELVVDGVPVHHNRKLSNPSRDKLALDMLSGDWRITHQGLAIDTDLLLRDGRTRAHACIKAGRPIPVTVAYNQDPQAFPYYDGSRTRTNAHATYTSGLADVQTPAVASANSLVFNWHQGTHQKTWGSKAPARGLLLNHLAENPGIADWVYRSSACRSKLRNGGGPNLPVAPMAAALYVCEEAYPRGRYEEFMDGLESLYDPRSDGLPAGDPRRMLTRWLGHNTRDVKQRGNRPPRITMGVLIKTLNHFHSGVPITSALAMRMDEGMPRPYSAES